MEIILRLQLLVLMEHQLINMRLEQHQPLLSETHLVSQLALIQFGQEMRTTVLHQQRLQLRNQRK